MEMLPQQLLNGIILGGTYGLIAVGLTLIFGLLRIFNIAHGEVMTLGAFAYYYASSLAGLPWPVCLVSSILVGIITGYIVERLLFRKFIGDTEGAFIMAFGVSMAIQGIGFYFWKGVPRYTNPPIDGVFDLGWLTMPYHRMLVFGLTILSFVLLYYFLRKTKTGKSIRAIAQNPTAASLMGISSRWTYQLIFLIGSGMAGLCGGMLATQMTVGPFMGHFLVLKAFVVVVLGGMGSVPGALVGGLILGMVESLGSSYLSPYFRDGYGFILLILILLFRPKGLFGSKSVI